MIMVYGNKWHTPIPKITSFHSQVAEMNVPYAMEWSSLLAHSFGRTFAHSLRWSTRQELGERARVFSYVPVSVCVWEQESVFKCLCVCVCGSEYLATGVPSEM